MATNGSQTILTTSSIQLRSFDLSRLIALLIWVLLLVGVASAQDATEQQMMVIRGTYQGPAVAVGAR